MHEEILSILALHQADPLLLLSCCKYTTKYFGLTDVLYNPQTIQDKLWKLDNCTKLLPYLGGTSFEQALEQCEQYLNLESTTKTKRDRFNMEDQHNPLMNDLLIAIINVIELVSF